MKRLLLSLLISALAYNGYGQSVTLDSEWDTSAEIATAVGDETGTAGALVFNTTPTFVGDLVLTERADHASTPSAGFGYIWTKNTVPATLIFTDDAGTDFTLSPSSIDIDALTQATEADLISDANHAILVSDGGTEKYITTEDWQDFIESLSLTLSSLDITTLTTDTIDGNGAVDMDYGSADITDHTFTTDGTGDSEIVLPNDSIGDAEVNITYSETFTILEPDSVQGVSDDIVLKKFIAEKYPSGVTITSIHIDASAAYTSETFLFEHWDNASGTTQATVESIAASAISTEDDGTLTDATIPADYFLVVNLDDTPEDVAYAAITISYTID